MPVTPAEFLAMQVRLAKGKPQAPVPDDAVDRESTLHDEILAWCKHRGWLAFHSRMDKKTTRKKGECDFYCLLPKSRFILVECKSKNSKLSIEQQGVIAWAKKLGHTIHVVTSIGQFDQICQMELSERKSETLRSPQGGNPNPDQDRLS